MIITETWLKDDNCASPVIADITNCLPDHQFLNRPRSSRGGGLCAILRKGYTVNCNNGPHFNSFEHLDLRVESGLAHFRLIAVYRPPPSKKNKLSIPQFFDEFSCILEAVLIQTNEVVLVSDFNFHLDNVLGNADASAFAGLLSSFGLTQHVREPTTIVVICLT